MQIIKINKTSIIKYTIKNKKILINKIYCKAKDWQEIMDTLELLQESI